jgi:hypothetical protein
LLVSESEDLPTNWGRWGDRDERGTLNLITAEVRARALAEARSGRTVSISRPMPTSPIVAGPTAALGVDSIGVMQATLFTGTTPRGTAAVYTPTGKVAISVHSYRPLSRLSRINDSAETSNRAGVGSTP